MGVITIENMSPGVMIMVSRTRLPEFHFWHYPCMLSCMPRGQFLDLSVPVSPSEKGADNSAYLRVIERIK